MYADYVFFAFFCNAFYLHEKQKKNIPLFKRFQELKNLEYESRIQKKRVYMLFNHKENENFLNI